MQRIIVFHLRSLLLFSKSLLFPFGKIEGTSVRHCRWGGERGCSSDVVLERGCLFGVCAKATKLQICPKTFVHDCRLIVKPINVDHAYKDITNIE